MSQTLSNGYKLPEDGDLGDTWFDDLEDNIQRVNDHTHNGVNSEKLSSSAIEAASITVASGDFTLASGVYTASITLPSTAEYDKTLIQLRDATSREQIYGKVTRVSSTQGEIELNTALDLLVVFG